MALPRWERETVRYGLPEVPRRVESPGRSPRRSPGRAPERSSKEVLRRRRVLLLIVVPVLMMLGSVYLHTVAAGYGDRAAVLQERADQARLEGKRLDVEVAKFSAPGRIRTLAEEDLDMRDPASKDLEVYDKDGEDGAQNPQQRASEGSE